MIKKGIIMCGGNGTRLLPLTKSVNKQLLPVYNKPMFFYPLSVLMLGNIKSIMLVVNKNQKELFQNILGNTKDLGIKVSHKIQKKSKGIAECFTLCKDFIKKDNIALILGDNFFYGSMLTPLIKKSFKSNEGASIFVYPSKNTSSYGVVETNVGIHELLKITDGLKNTILKSSDSTTIKKQGLKEKMITLRRDGINKILHGLTTAEEILSITSE